MSSEPVYRQPSAWQVYFMQPCSSTSQRAPNRLVSVHTPALHECRSHSAAAVSPHAVPSGAFAMTQAPLWQIPPTWQSPSSTDGVQVVPSAMGTAAQLPWSSQTPVLHGSGGIGKYGHAVPALAGTALQPPSWQTPVLHGWKVLGVQASPSSPATHAPVAGSHFCGQSPKVSPQFFGTPTQPPAPSQVLTLHRLPTSHGVPTG